MTRHFDEFEHLVDLTGRGDNSPYQHVDGEVVLAEGLDGELIVSEIFLLFVCS